MKRKRYSVEQIVAAVKQHELRTLVADIARKLGIAERPGGSTAITAANAAVAWWGCAPMPAGDNAVLPTRQADGQRVHRIIQRLAARRISERAMARWFDGRKDEAASLAAGELMRPGLTGSR